MKIKIIYGNILQVDGRFLQASDLPALESNWPKKPVVGSIEPVVRRALSEFTSVWFARLTPDPASALLAGAELGDGTGLSFDHLQYEHRAMQTSLRKLGFDAELRIASSGDSDMNGLCVLATLLKPYQAENLVYLRASGSRSCRVMDTPPPGVTVDLVRGLWSQQRGGAIKGCMDTFIIGEPIPPPNGRVAALGVYDRTQTSHLDLMVGQWGEIVHSTYSGWGED